MYKVTITFYDGKKQTLKDEDWDLCGLMQAIDKCDIKSFTIELAPLDKT